MFYLRRAAARGQAHFGWLHSQHSFSFGDYYDPQHMGFSVLRVINDDVVQPGAGFAPHGHRDMEIISYILEGTISHRDSIGHQQQIPAGDIQLMSAGHGISHSEYNASQTEPLHFLQIWITPKQRGVTPNYQQRALPTTEGINLLVSPDGRDGSLLIHQDICLYRINLSAGQTLQLTPENGAGYLHLISGSLDVHQLSSGDGLATTSPIEAQVQQQLHALWFDLPAPAQ